MRSPTADTTSRRLDIQGLRALAVLLVVGFHAGLPLPGGFVGVDVFFVISGFVITGLLLREWSTQGRIDFRRFYVRRVRRLLPALALVAFVTSVVSILVQPPNGEQQQTAQTALGAMLIAANVVIPRLEGDYFAREATANPLLHTWSLSVEEQFYLLFPALLLAGLVATRHRGPRLSGATLIIGATSIGSLVFAITATYAPFERPPMAVLLSAFYSSPARAWEFGVGALVALASARLERSRPAVLVAGGVAGSAAVLLTATLINSRTPFPGLAALAPVFGTALMLASGLAPATALARALSVRPLVWIGDRSYSWYLWHWPAIVFARVLFPFSPSAAIGGAGLSLCAAYLSFRFVENPIRFSPRVRGARLAAVVGLSLALSIASAGLLGLGARAGWGQEWALGAHVALQRRCDAGTFDPDRCRWSTPGAIGSVLLVGDSQAWAVADGVIAAAKSLGLDTIVAAHSNCVFASPEAAAASGDATFMRAECAATNRALLQFGQTNKPTVVVIANNAIAQVAAHRAAWSAGVAAAVQHFRAAGIGVVLVGAIPVADDDANRTALLVRPSGDRFTLVAAQRELRRDANDATHDVARGNPGTVVFDPGAVLCDAERCDVARGGTQFYADRIHLSRPGALLLMPALRESLKQATAGVSVSRTRLSTN